MITYKNFTPAEHETWKQLFNRQAPLRDQQIVPEFSNGLELLEITADRVPDLNAVNFKLKALTGFQGIPVEGLELGGSFYPLLAERKFPIGNFIRDPKDLSYTPAPDVFHDLYGHLPFFTNSQYADFCAKFGAIASRHISNPEVLKRFERFFWFTIEFGLVETPKGRRIFGAGIASSFGECKYALSDEPEVVPFHVETILNQDYRIDVFQKRLFLLKSADQLYQSLETLETKTLKH